MPQTGDVSVRACLVVNPRSGRGGVDLTDALDVLRANNWQVAVRQKQQGGEATKIARDAAASGYDVVVGCGGDGTLSEIVDGLAGSDVALGVIPGGTVNLWAGELGVSSRPRVAAQQLVTAERRRADLGHLEINGHQGRYFLLMAGIGFDGAVIERISKPLKQRVGGPAVWLATLRAIPAARAASVSIDLDGAPWTGEISQIVAGNTRRYGGFARVTPSARLDDARLDICLFTATGALQSLRQAASLLLRGEPSYESAEVYRAARIAVQSPVVLPVQIDGGKVSMKNVVAGSEGVRYLLSSRPAALTVLVPSTYDGGLFQQIPAVNPADFGEMKHPGPADGEDTVDGDAGSDAAEERYRLRVTSVGVDTITGIDMKSDRSLTAVVGPKTRTRDADGKRLPVATFLSSIQDGDLVRIKGVLDGDRGLIRARRLKLDGRDKRG